MKPALSIVVFTVLSGAGLGLAAALAFFGGGDALFWRAAALSVLLTGGGLLASVWHLANPKNAWRAVMRLRSSWLSREAVLAFLFFALTALWALHRYRNGGGGIGGAVLPAAAGFCALATVFCTAMIYQSLKPIAAWNHPLTSINYLALSLTSGAALFAALSGGRGAAFAAVVFAATSAVGKLMHYRRIGKAKGIRIGRAAGFSRAKAKLLEAGHTGPTFLTREFIFDAPADLLRRLRIAAMLLCFAPPVAGACAILFAKAAPSPFAETVMAASIPPMFCGLLCERWLFFAEARHAVRAYHGDGAP